MLSSTLANAKVVVGGRGGRRRAAVCVCVCVRDFLFNLTRELRNWVLPAGNWEGTSWQKGRVNLAPTPTPMDSFLFMTVK